MAENVHEESIGTRTGIKLHPASLLTARKGSSALRVDLCQASVPRPIPSNRLVASLQEIPMPRVVLIRGKAHDRNFSVAKRVRQGFRLGELLGTLGQVTAKGSGKIHGHLFRRSMPLPQLLPRLHSCLHLSGVRRTAVDQPAILVSLLVKITNRCDAKVCEVVTEFLEILLGRLFRFIGIRTACHSE